MLAVPERGPRPLVGPCHVLLIDTQQEKLAASHLSGRGVACYLPTELAHRRRGARRKLHPVEVPIFRGYLFVEIGYSVTERDTVWGIRKHMQFDGRPAVVSEYWMRRVRELERQRQNPEMPFSVGAQVRIIDGAFVDKMAQVHACDRESVTVLLDMLGRKVPSKLNIFDVELVS